MQVKKNFQRCFSTVHNLCIYPTFVPLTLKQFTVPLSLSQSNHISTEAYGWLIAHKACIQGMYVRTIWQIWQDIAISLDVALFWVCFLDFFNISQKIFVKLWADFDIKSISVNPNIIKMQIFIWKNVRMLTFLINLLWPQRSHSLSRIWISKYPSRFIV